MRKSEGSERCRKSLLHILLLPHSTMNARCARDRAEQQDLGAVGSGAGPATGQGQADIEPNVEALSAAIEGYGSAPRPLASTSSGYRIYEVGWSGFWLARWLATRGIETHVVHPRVFG